MIIQDAQETSQLTVTKLPAGIVAHVVAERDEVEGVPRVPGRDSPVARGVRLLGRDAGDHVEARVRCPPMHLDPVCFCEFMNLQV